MNPRVTCPNALSKSSEEIPEIARYWLSELQRMKFGSAALEKLLRDVKQIIDLQKMRKNKSTTNFFARSPLEHYGRKMHGGDYYVPAAVLGLILLHLGYTLEIFSDNSFRANIDKRDLLAYESEKNFHMLKLEMRSWRE